MVSIFSTCCLDHAVKRLHGALIHLEDGQQQQQSSWGESQRCGHRNRETAKINHHAVSVSAAHNVWRSLTIKDCSSPGVWCSPPTCPGVSSAAPASVGSSQGADEPEHGSLSPWPPDCPTLDRDRKSSRLLKTQRPQREVSHFMISL